MAYLKENERYIIETMLKDNKSVKDIANRLNRCISTVYAEIKRGTVELLNTDLTTRACYCADVAQRKHDTVKHNKGIALKIGSDFNTADFIEHLIKDKKYTPYAVECELKNNADYTYLCTSTIYNYIHKNIFLNISDSDLPYNVKTTKEKKSVRRPSLKMLGTKTIEERDNSIYNRDDYGNWELDTVYSGKNTSKCCLLVFTERMTREEKIYKLADRTSQSVLDKINELEKEIGYTAFRSKFKTITCDNGVEFTKHKEIEHSCITENIRTSLYFCHPFCSCERGSNENANKLIRKYIPKGCDIGGYTDDDIKQIENLINNYPRRLFNGLSTNQYKLQLGL
jgi:IS30 family transposase